MKDYSDNVPLDTIGIIMQNSCTISERKGSDAALKYVKEVFAYIINGYKDSRDIQKFFGVDYETALEFLYRTRYGLSLEEIRTLRKSS